MPPNSLKRNAQGRNRTTDTAIFSRMLYQLSYLGTRQPRLAARGHTGCPPGDQAASGPSSESTAGLRQARPAARVCGTAQSASGRGPPRRSAGCKTAVLPRQQACRRSGSAHRRARFWAGARSWRLHCPGVARQRRVATQDQSTSGAPRKIRHRARVPFQRRHNGRRSAQGGHPARVGRHRAATARNAARPAACGPASNSCSGGCTRGRTISASPSAVNPSRRGRPGSSASASASAGPSAERRRTGSPARSTRIAPDRLRSRICRARAGSSARLIARCPPRRCRGIHVDRHQRRGRMDRQPGAGRQLHLRLRPARRSAPATRRRTRTPSRRSRPSEHRLAMPRQAPGRPPTPAPRDAAQPAAPQPGTAPHQPRRPATHPLLRFFRQSVR